ncbi:ASCH domain-containing protein [Sulfoacidibacillus thermotolerans]|uniref:ASCH domain-containing protein n=1 Tax=Sulfoacidibacillus thermotolerans TaxID=1765684 RepID=A0A2U3DBU3_SULT2|nr:ASCH domain-containing protein [Sulfoacidibacillus thermotolerans]PWI58743.1 hypothetical protein BM613_01205 [Sulfoacidibacillus thermotolerans]
MSESFPPKTCSIDRLVTREEDVARILRGEKTAVRRNGRYADPGEQWMIREHRFLVEKVYRQKLGEMTDEDAKKEGFLDLASYQEYLQTVHPGMPFAPGMPTWVHEFRAIK